MEVIRENFLHKIRGNIAKEMELIIGLIFWWSVGGFDWINDTYECVTHITPVIDPLQKNITMTVENYINTLVSFKRQIAVPDVLITEEFAIGTKTIKETVAMPGIQNIAIEQLQENMSDSWVVTKSNAGVIRYN